MNYSEFYKSLVFDSIEKGKPLVAIFELTSRCNLRCKMCYICGQDDSKSLMSRELSADQWIKIGEAARDAGVLYLTLTGGEIFIRKDFWDIYNALSHMGFIITLYTNATLITDEIIERLKKIPPFTISITVYGANPETYEKVTGNYGAFEKVMENIRKLKSADLPVELKTTVIKSNCTQYEQLARLALTVNHSVGVVNYISPRREGTGTDPLSNRLEPLELVRYEKFADECARKIYREKYGNDRKEEKLVIEDVMLDNKTAKKEIFNSSKSAFRCAAGRYAFWLSWDGKMYPCGLLDMISSEVLDVDFNKSWDDLRNKCDNVPYCQECENCRFYNECMICPARRMAETGSFEKPAPYICEHEKARELIFNQGG